MNKAPIEKTVLPGIHSPASFEWTLQNFLHMPTTKPLNSPTFRFFEAEWFLNICFRKNDIALYLFKKDSPSAYRITFTCGIKKVDGSLFKPVTRSGSFDKTESAHHSCNIQVSEIRMYRDVLVPGGTLTIFCTAHIFVEETIAASRVEVATQTPTPDGIEILSKHFKESFLNGYHSDIKINVKGKEFAVHKMVLAARSPVFRSMLDLDMREKNEGVINITDCDADSFEDFLLYLYSGKQDIVSSNNALDLYLTSDKYNIEELKKLCSDCLARNISVNSFCDIMLLSTLHEETDLLNVATEFFMVNANEIVTTPKWLSFMRENLTLANELLIQMTDKSKMHAKSSV